MSSEPKVRRSETFDEAAALYDKVRPRYPQRLFDDLVELTQLAPDSRVLEIGSGTGQATVPLAERGYRILAVESGGNLADEARRNLAPFPSVQVVTTRFEDWPLPAEPFDAVVSATAFHWLDPSVRVHKSADALRPGGALAIISTNHVAGGDTEFFAEAQFCYRRWTSAASREFHLPTADEISSSDDEFTRSGRFGPATFRRYEWEASYSATTYADLLLTYSDHRAMKSDVRHNLLRCIGEIIDSKFRGHINKRYLNELMVTYRLPN